MPTFDLFSYQLMTFVPPQHSRQLQMNQQASSEKELLAGEAEIGSRKNCDFSTADGYLNNTNSYSMIPPVHDHRVEDH